MRLCGLPLICRDPAGPWCDEKSQSKNLSIFGRLRMAGMYQGEMHTGLS